MSRALFEWSSLLYISAPVLISIWLSFAEKYDDEVLPAINFFSGSAEISY